MTWQDLWTVALVLPGCFFVSVGTLGLLRLHDLHSRVHALAKADTLGLGLLVLGLLPQVEPAGARAKLLLVWALALVSAAVIAHLVVRGVTPGHLAEPDRPPAGGAR